MFKFIRDGLSLDETRISILIIFFIIFSGFGIYQYHINKDITENLLNIILALIYCIAGVNGVGKISEIISNYMNKNNNQL